MTLCRRSWVLLAILATAAAARGQAPPPNVDPLRIVSGPYLQSATESTMTVMWITNRNATGDVEFGAREGGLKTVHNSHDGLVDGNERVHKVVLGNLAPGTDYRYRILSRDIVTFGSNQIDYGETVASGFQEFRTFDRRRQSVSFLVFNDIHDTPATIGELLKIAGGHPFDFVALNGDTLSHIEREEQIVSVLNEASSQFASRLPLVWVRGNHETRGNFARQFPAYLDSPNGRYFYSFDQGPVHVIVLDTGEDKMDSHAEYSGLADFSQYRREEAEWLKAEVATEAFRRAKYRVVLAHMPFPSASRSRSQNGQPNPFTGMAEDYETFGATLDQAGVDMMISGHTHSPAIIQPEPGRHSYPIIRGGGPKGPNRTLIRVDVNQDALDAVVLRPDGSTFGTYRVAAKR